MTTTTAEPAWTYNNPILEEGEHHMDGVPGANSQEQNNNFSTMFIQERQSETLLARTRILIDNLLRRARR